MRVLVVRAPVGGPIEVRDVGVAGTATWRGAVPPAGRIGTEVELNVLSDVDWNDISVGSALLDIVPRRSNGLVIKGAVVDVDQYGVLTLDTGGGIVLLDTVGDPPLGIAGRPVELEVRDVELFPVDP